MLDILKEIDSIMEGVDTNFDILNQLIDEGTSEFKDNCPSMNPTQHFDADNSGNHTISVPGGDNETPKSKPWDILSLTIPGGDNEKPTAKNGDTGVPNPGKVTLDSDAYNVALTRLQQSFKEGYECLEGMKRGALNAENINESSDFNILNMRIDENANS